MLEFNPDHDPISYSYVKHGNRSYLKEIAFGGGRSTYSFDLLDTQANLVSNVTGERQVNSKLYSRITASFDGDVYNRWCFAYIGRSETGSGQFWSAPILIASPRPRPTSDRRRHQVDQCP